MKRLNLSIAVCAAILITACHETKEDLNRQLSEKDIYRKVGEEIPFETGMQWLDFHRKASTTARLNLFVGCKVPAATVKSMLSSAENLVGVAFHYGIDDFGASHIILIPVTETMELWSSTSGRILIDGNTGLAISPERAEAWAEKYKSLYASDIWYHFFGKDIFDEMQALPYFEVLDIEPATNPEDLSAQLLLVIWNDSLLATGRTNNEPGKVYDASNPCPPCATD